MQTLRVARDFSEIMHERAKSLGEMDAILAEVGVEHGLIGGLAVGYHGRERATVDVDMLVPRRKLKALAAAIRRHGYMTYATQDMVRVYPRGGNHRTDSFADLVAMEAHPVLRAAFKEKEPAIVLGHRVKIVSRGALVALKFHAVMSPTRQIGDRYQDVADIDRIITKKFTDRDVVLARSIAALSYPGARKDFDQLIDDLRHGRPVTL